MCRVLQLRPFRFLWLSGLISQVGDWLLAIALPVYLYQTTGSTLATGAMFVAQSVPRVICGLAAGVFVDRWDRRRILIATDVARGLLLLGLLGVHPRDSLLLLYSVVACDSLLALFAVPAQLAIVPAVVGERDIATANSLRALSWELARLCAPPLGGFIFIRFGFSSIVIIDSVSFFASAVLMQRLVVQHRPATVSQRAHARDHLLNMLWQELGSGLRSVFGNRRLMILCSVAAVSMLAEGIINVLGFPWLQQVLHGGALERGWLATAQAVGGIVGGLSLPWLTQRVSYAWTIGMSGIATGVLALLLIHVTALPVSPALHWPVALLLKGGTGAGIVGFSVGLSSLIVRDSPADVRGRVLALYGVSSAGAVLLGQLAASLLGDSVGVVALLSLQSVLYIVAGAITLLALPRSPA